MSDCKDCRTAYLNIRSTLDDILRWTNSDLPDATIVTLIRAALTPPSTKAQRLMLKAKKALDKICRK